MSTAIDAAEDHAFFGHPRGLSTLFFTEMWERFSFYGMRAILLLYMTTSLAKGGLNFEQKYAGLIFGTYASSVYWTPLIGGWLADRILGARRAVLIGGIIIACGHFSMAFRTTANFYGGLVLIALGTGLLKPNVSTMVGDLYSEKDERRDAGFSIFYMGINLGALFAPIICGYLGQRVDWHYGFAAAGIGMVIGLVQYVSSGHRLSRVGNKPVKKDLPDTPQAQKVDYLTVVLALAGGVVGSFLGMRWGGQGWLSGLFPGVVGFFFGYISGTLRKLTGDEAKRVGVIFILFVFSVVFWMSFEQAATSLTLFADRLTRTSIFGWDFPSSWFQSVEPVFVILFAPVFAAIWLKMGKRQPSSPGKFVIGLLFAGLAFSLIAFASTLAGGGRLSPLWLVAVYLLQTLGELCLYPVGMSSVSKLSPARLMGLMMGVWLLSIAIGDFIAGLAAGLFNEKTEGALLHLFGGIAAITFVAAFLLLALTPLIKRLTPRTA
jgi:POT family proton-dependent oligopeptide transporter